MSDEQAVFTEPLAAALEILEQINIRGDDRVLVVGAGRLGQLIARVLAATGCELDVSARYDRQKELLAEAGIRSVSPEAFRVQPYDIVVEATGSAEGLEDALSLVRRRGTIVLQSTVAGAREMNLTPVVVNEITLIGSRCGPFAPALRALAAGEIDVKPLVTAVYGVDDALEAFERAGEKESLKILVDFR